MDRQAGLQRLITSPCASFRQGMCNLERRKKMLTWEVTSTRRSSTLSMYPPIYAWKKIKTGNLITRGMIRSTSIKVGMRKWRRERETLIDSLTSAFEATEIDPTDRTCSGAGWHCAPCICAGNEDDFSCLHMQFVLVGGPHHVAAPCGWRWRVRTLDGTQTGEKRVGVADAGGTGEFRHESGGHKYTHAHS